MLGVDDCVSWGFIFLGDHSSLIRLVKLEEYMFLFIYVNPLVFLDSVIAHCKIDHCGQGKLLLCITVSLNTLLQCRLCN